MRSSMATRKRSTPPESWRASTEMWRRWRICPPRMANVTITPKDTEVAWIAARRCLSGAYRLVSPKKTGTVPMGSMMTVRVANAVANSVTSKKLTARPPRCTRA